MAQYFYTTRMSAAYGILGGMFTEGSAPVGYTAGVFYYFNGTALVDTFSAVGKITLTSSTYAGQPAMRGLVPAGFEGLGIAIQLVALLWEAVPTTTDWIDMAELPFYTGIAWSDGGSSDDEPVPSPSNGRDFLPFLYADALEHLVDFTGGSSSGVSQSLCRRSVLNAYLTFTNETDWQFLTQHGRINLVAPYSTGTIAFDLTGGSAERLLTLTGGTWPAWARYGHININDVIYDVDQRLSDTTLSLDSVLCPADDIASGTSYVLYRNVYPLPNNFKRLLPPTTQHVWASRYVAPEKFLWLERHNRQSGTPYNWTVMQSRTRAGQYDIFLHGYPTSAETLDFIYQRTIRSLVYTGYDSADETGVVSVVSGSGTVIGIGTAFTSRMEGSYLRFSTDTATKPSGLGGLNPFGEQRKILKVNSATSLLLDEEVDNTYASTKFRISDPIDIPQYAWDAMLRCIEWKYSTVGRQGDPEDFFRFYRSAMLKTRENDSIVDIPRSLGSHGGRRDRSWNLPLADNIT